MGGTGRQIELHEIIAMEREREAALKAAAEEAKVVMDTYTCPQASSMRAKRQAMVIM